MSTLDKAIEDLQAVVEAYALGKVDELAFVLPANAVLAAYAARPALAVPEGYALVPVEPTEEMLDEGGKWTDAYAVWAAMLASAQGVK